MEPTQHMPEDFPLADFFSFDIRPYVTEVEFESGDCILREGERPRYLYYLTRGRAKLFLTHGNGRVTLINFLSGPCFIGEMEFLGAQEEANGVTAITGCSGFAIDTAACGERLLADAGFLRRLCVFLGRKALGNTENYSENQAYPLENRLAKFILLTAGGGMYRERHTEAAEFLGVTYRHLLYVLADFVRRGLLQRTPAGYRILKREALERLAEGQE